MVAEAVVVKSARSGSRTCSTVGGEWQRVYNKPRSYVRIAKKVLNDHFAE